MTQPRKHPASLSSCLPKGNGIQGILPLSKHHPAVLSQLQPFFLFLEILQRIPRPFQAPPEELSYGTRRTKSPSCKSPRSPPHVDFLLQTELTLHSPTANWVFFFFFNSTSFPSRTYFPEIHRNFTFRFPPPAWFGCQQQESLPSLIFLGNQTKSCSWSWTTPDPFGKQEIQSGLAGDSVGRINISSALSTFSRSSFSSRGHGSILRQEKEMPAVQIPHPGSSAAGIYLPVEL